MANPQKENGFTPIANEILERLGTTHISPNQWQVLVIILRKTYGFNKKADYLTNSQIEIMTGLGKSVVSRALKELHEKNIIVRNGKVTGIQKDWERWKVSSLANKTEVSNSVNFTPKVSSSANNEKLAISSSKLAISSTKVSSPIVTQKTKETITKEIPSFIDKETWDGFVELRKKLKAPLTARATDLIFKELEKLKDEGQDPNAVLNQSIMRGWRGVFALKAKPVKGAWD